VPVHHAQVAVKIRSLVLVEIAVLVDHAYEDRPLNILMPMCRSLDGFGDGGRRLSDIRLAAAVEILRCRVARPPVYGITFGGSAPYALLPITVFFL